MFRESYHPHLTVSSKQRLHRCVWFVAVASCLFAFHTASADDPRCVTLGQDISLEFPNAPQTLGDAVVLTHKCSANCSATAVFDGKVIYEVTTDKSAPIQLCILESVYRSDFPAPCDGDLHRDYLVFSTADGITDTIEIVAGTTDGYTAAECGIQDLPDMPADENGPTASYQSYSVGKVQVVTGITRRE